MSPECREPIPPGTLDMLILQVVDQCGASHGFEIAEAIARRSAEVLRVEEGSLYPALQRLLVNGWVSGRWGRTAENRKARYYTITRAGCRHLRQELASYHRVTHAITAVLNPA